MAWSSLAPPAARLVDRVVAGALQGGLAPALELRLQALDRGVRSGLDALQQTRLFGRLTRCHALRHHDADVLAGLFLDLLEVLAQLGDRVVVEGVLEEIGRASCRERG